MNVNTTNKQKSISVWFVCKSCEFTFSFPTVDEFLEHKKEKHFVEFQKVQCIVFEERKQDEFFARTDQDEETKLFAQDEDRYVVVELCPVSGTNELFTETAEEPPSPALPLPVAKPTSPPVELCHSDTAIETTAAASLNEEISKHEYESNGDFGLFSSRINTSENDPRDPQADPFQIDSAHTARSTQLVQSHGDVESDSSDFSPENLDSDPDFSCANSDADSDKSNVEDLIDPLSDNLCDAPNNAALTNTLNPTLKNPFVLLRRLTAKELASSASNLIVSSKPPSQRKMQLRKKLKKTRKNGGRRKRKETGGPFLCTICSNPFENKTLRGLHMRSHFEDKSGPRPFNCSYPDCTSSFKHAYELDRHKARHEKGKLNPKLKSIVNKVFFCFPETDSSGPLNLNSALALREWLCEQKKHSENFNSRQTETEIDQGNIIRLDPDLTAMDETAAEALEISSETPVQCRLCGQSLESAAHVQVHATHCWLKNKRRHRYCFPCNKTLSSRKTLRKHITNKHSLDRKTIEYSCPLCPKKTRAEAHLKSHMKAHTRIKQQVRKDKTWVCEICGSAYSYQFKLINHQKTHGEETPIKCPHPGCGRAFKTKSHLRSHLLNHIQLKSFSCPKEGCSKSFKTKYELKLHLKRLSHLGVSRPGPKTKTKSWKCDHENCGKWYPDIPALNRHRISAHGVKTELPTFECHICGKTFTYKLSLTRHVWVHNNDSPFKCTHEGCGKTYKNKTTLAEHIYTHTGERPYQCDLCGKDYNAKSSLNRHLEWHQIDNLPFNCEHCEKSFKTVYNLKAHVNRIHQKNSTVKLQIEAGSLIEADLY